MVLDVLHGCWSPNLRPETAGIRPGTCTATEDVFIAEWLQIVESWVSWVGVFKLEFYLGLSENGGDHSIIGTMVIIQWNWGYTLHNGNSPLELGDIPYFQRNPLWNITRIKFWSISLSRCFQGEAPIFASHDEPQSVNWLKYTLWTFLSILNPIHSNTFQLNHI